MAKYIDRNLIEWYGCNFEEPSCENRECSGCSHAECSHSQVMQIPPADVIERSKIDNALADMQSMLDQERLNDNVISDVGQGIEIAMGLLKENIGE